MEKLVTIANFDSPAEAETMKLLLEQQGFQVFLADDKLVGMNWFLSNAVGGAKLQVLQSDADVAARYMEEQRRRVRDSSEETSKSDITFTCGDCRKDITFSGKRRGRVETCPHCQAYVDVHD